MLISDRKKHNLIKKPSKKRSNSILELLTKAVITR